MKVLERNMEAIIAVNNDKKEMIEKLILFFLFFAHWSIQKSFPTIFSLTFLPEHYVVMHQT